jgi:hypothetical protein
MNAYDILAEIGVGSVQRDTRRFVAGRGVPTARHVAAPGVHQPRMVETATTRRQRRRGLAPRVLVVVIDAARAVVGSASVHVARLATTWGLSRRVDTAGEFEILPWGDHRPVRADGPPPCPSRDGSIPGPVATPTDGIRQQYQIRG